jgi:hypothetical protein
MTNHTCIRESSSDRLQRMYLWTLTVLSTINRELNCMARRYRFLTLSVVEITWVIGRYFSFKLFVLR